MNLPSARLPQDKDNLRSWLSALADGEAAAVKLGCDAWRDDEQARRTWHTYHLIGDVLRSEELASEPARDAAFVAAVRLRLADEPVVLAPAALPPARRRLSWLAPAAVAAGFVVVAGVLVVARIGAPGADSAGPVLASASAPAAPLALVDSTAAPVGQRLLINGKMIRDAGLDNYLRAHRDMRTGSAAALPGGAMRSVDTLVPAQR
jgi:sigma-E factor negative regulatory protein RseA